MKLVRCAPTSYYWDNGGAGMAELTLIKYYAGDGGRISPAIGTITNAHRRFGGGYCRLEWRRVD